MKVIVFGSGGQARVVAEIILNNKNLQLLGFVDPYTKDKNEKIFGLPIRDRFAEAQGFIIGVGNNQRRAQRFDQMLELGLKPVTIIHPTANIAKDVTIGQGTIIAMGATIATGAQIGSNVIINTGAIVEHENVIGNNVHIAPGAALAGRVKVKNGAFVGLRALVRECLTVGTDAVVPDNATVVGIPARPL
jgi:sugar O-acyltransferase (sialic acid O-acetyltransferase NeuD family)